MSSISLNNLFKTNNNITNNSTNNTDNNDINSQTYTGSVASGLQIESSEDMGSQQGYKRYVPQSKNENNNTNNISNNYDYQYEKPGSYRVYESASCNTIENSKYNNNNDFSGLESDSSLYKKYGENNNIVNVTQKNNLICDEPTFSPSKNSRKFRKQNTLDPDFDSPYQKNNMKQFEPGQQQQNVGGSQFQKQQKSEDKPLIKDFIKVQKVNQEQNGQNFVKNNLYFLQDFKNFVSENISTNENNQNQKTDINDITNDSVILQYKNLATLENTFFKSVGILHFKHMLYNDHIDIHNLSLFDLFERVKNKKMILKPSPIQHPDTTQEDITDMFCNNIYTLIKLKTQVKKFQLFQAFLDMIQKQPIFLESLMLMLKELVLETIENCESDPQYEEYKSLKSIINHTWIEMKPEFISLLSHTLNKQIEVIYILENRVEVMKYDKLLTRYNYEQTKMKLVYYHSNSERKSFYFPVLSKSEEELFALDKKELKAVQKLYMEEQTPLNNIPFVKQASSKLFQDNLFESNANTNNANTINQEQNNNTNKENNKENKENNDIKKDNSSFHLNTNKYMPNYQTLGSIPNLNLKDMKIDHKLSLNEVSLQNLNNSNNNNSNMFQKLQKHSNTMTMILDENMESHHIGTEKEINNNNKVYKQKNQLKNKLKNELELDQINEVESNSILKNQQQIIDSKDVVSFISSEEDQRQITVVSENEQNSSQKEFQVEIQNPVIAQKEHIFQKEVVSEKLQGFMELFKKNSDLIESEIQKESVKDKENGGLKENNNIQNLQQKQAQNSNNSNNNNKNQAQTQNSKPQSNNSNNNQTQQRTLMHSNSQKKIPQRGSILGQQQSQGYRTIAGNIMPQPMYSNMPAMGQQHFIPPPGQGMQYIYGQPQRMFIN